MYSHRNKKQPEHIFAQAVRKELLGVKIECFSNIDDAKQKLFIRLSIEASSIFA